MRLEGLSMKNSNDTIRNRTRDIPAISAVPQPIAPRRAFTQRHSTILNYVLKHLVPFNPLNAELNPICHLLALLGGATIVVFSRLRVNTFMICFVYFKINFLSKSIILSSHRNFLAFSYHISAKCLAEIYPLFLNLLKTKSRPLYLKLQSVPRCKHFSSRL